MTPLPPLFSYTFPSCGINLDTITTMATTEHSEQLHEKQNGMNGNYDPEAQRLDALKQFRSAASVQMSPELFEKLYLSPMNEVKGELRQTFGNPTPMYARPPVRLPLIRQLTVIVCI